jgi:hypothetical protein
MLSKNLVDIHTNQDFRYMFNIVFVYLIIPVFVLRLELKCSIVLSRFGSMRIQAGSILILDKLTVYGHYINLMFDHQHPTKVKVKHTTSSKSCLQMT